MPFFLLVLGLSIPLWILGSIVGGDLLPGLPVSAVQFLCPVTAASLLLYRRSGAAEVAALLKRSFDFTRITDPVRYVSVLLLIPAAYGLSYIIILVLGRPVAGVELNLLAIPLLLVIFFIGGLAEELGWSGYALDPMQRRWSALRAALLLGAFWAVWHWVPLLEAGRSWVWIAWWSLSSVSLRLLHVWLYNSTGKSVFGQALFHAAPNVAWQVLPSAYEPAITGPILCGCCRCVGQSWRDRRSREALNAGYSVYGSLASPPSGSDLCSIPSKPPLGPPSARHSACNTPTAFSYYEVW